MTANFDPVLDRVTVAATEALISFRQEARRAGSTLTLAEEEQFVTTTCAGLLDREASEALFHGRVTLSVTDESRVTRRVVDHLLGMGPLQPLLDDPDITDVHVRGAGSVWVKKRNGERSEYPPIVRTDDELVSLVRNLASRSTKGERRFDAATVECNLCLSDGSRLFAVMDVSGAPSLVIRKHQFRLASLEDLRSTGVIDHALERFLRAAVRSKRNIVIAGGTGSGKTTLLRALMNEIPANERVVTIEDAYELGIDRFSDLHPDFDALQARPANVEGEGAVVLADLTRMALRMDPDRVIVGEVRGGEAFPMLLAMSQGNNGSMCTMHADSTRSVFPKLAAYVSMANTGLPVDIVNLVIATAVHLVVHVEIVDGVRRLTSVREVVDADGAQIVSNEIFSIDGSGPATSAFPMTSDLRRTLEGVGYRYDVPTGSIR